MHTVGMRTSLLALLTGPGLRMAGHSGSPSGTAVRHVQAGRSVDEPQPQKCPHHPLQGKETRAADFWLGSIAVVVGV